MTWGYDEQRKVLAPLMILDGIIQDGTALKPDAVMLPPSFTQGVTEFMGLPVVRGDRLALIYEPKEF